jgi:hypothetical protein
MDFNGPMYKVFTERDKSTILDWVESLRMANRPCVDPMPDVSPPDDLPKAVAQLIADHASDAMTAHDGIMVTLADAKPTPLKSLFEQPANVMRALLSNGWIVPGEQNRSMFFMRIINNGGPMDRIFNDPEKELIGAWIEAGAKMPAEEKAVTEKALDQVPSQELRDRLLAAAVPVSRRHLIGMGAVH